MNYKFLILELILAEKEKINELIQYVELVTPMRLRPHDDGSRIMISGKDIGAADGLTENEKKAGLITTMICIASDGPPGISIIYSQYCEILAHLLKAYRIDQSRVPEIKTMLNEIGNEMKSKFTSMGFYE